jgi:hypothetical protein
MVPGGACTVLPQLSSLLTRLVDLRYFGNPSSPSGVYYLSGFL